jgi:hypothetical protein
MFWTLEIPFKTGFTVSILTAVRTSDPQYSHSGLNVVNDIDLKYVRLHFRNDIIRVLVHYMPPKFMQGNI